MWMKWFYRKILFISLIKICLFLAAELVRSSGTLVVCPASLMDQWRAEVERRIAPGRLSVQVYHGPHRTKSPREYAHTVDCTMLDTAGCVSPSLYLAAYYVIEKHWDFFSSESDTTCIQ